MKLFVLALVSALQCSILLIFVFQLAAGRNVDIQVGAQWPEHSSSFILELSEFLSDQSPESFWEYAENMCTYSSAVDDVISFGNVPHSKERAEEQADKLHQLEAIAYSTAAAIALPAVHTLMDTMVNSDFITPTSLLAFITSYSSLGYNNSGLPRSVLLYSVILTGSHRLIRKIGICTVHCLKNSTPYRL